MENKRQGIDFYGKRKIFIGISLVIFAIGIVFNVINGTKLDIQFSGGAMIRYAVTDGEVTADEVETFVDDTLGKECSVSLSRGIVNESELYVTIAFAGNQTITLDEQTSLADSLSEKFEGLTFTIEESSSVDPVMGRSFFLKCIVCVLITVAFLLIYIGIRFRKIGGISAGITAIMAILHDILIVYFFFVVFKMPIDDIFIAIILTILGYSLNDTIVIYDRIRENAAKLGRKANYAEIVNLSLNQTLKRSILTSLTTFMALLVVGIVAFVYGITTVTTFAFPMMIGIVVGCYSSVCLAVPVYGMWKMRKKKSK